MEPKIMLIGAGCICVGAFLIVSGIRKNKRCSARTIGRITGVHEYEDIDSEGSSSYSYSPEFEYEVNGQTYHGFGGHSYNKPSKIQIGGNIEIHYNPEKPDERLPKGSEKKRAFMGAIAILVGIIYIVIGLQR